MQKSQSLFTDAKWNPGDRVLGEVEKNSFIALPGRGGHGRLMLLNNYVAHLGGFEEFNTKG